MFMSKRLVIILGIIVALVMLTTGIGLAYALTALNQQTTVNAHLSATATAAAAVVVPTPKAGPRRVTGVIQALSTSSFTMAVKRNKKTVTVTVNVDATTIYMHSGQKAAFSDLQVGQTVVVMGTVDLKGLTIQATHVAISPVAAKPTTTPTVSPTATTTP